MNHAIKMLIACVLPLLLIFLLPLIGVSNQVALLAFIVAMFVLHLLAMGGHVGHQPGWTENGHSNSSEGGHHGRS